MNFLKHYIEYFKYLAVVHPELLHDDQSGHRVFELIDVEEAFGDFRTAVKEKGVMMRLLLPFNSLTDEYGGNPRIPISGGFILAAYHGQREQGTPEFIAALQKSHRIAHEIAEKMISDASNGHPLFYNSIRSIQHLNWNAQSRIMVGDGTYSGYICTFSFEMHFRNCIDKHTDDTWKLPTPNEF